MSYMTIAGHHVFISHARYQFLRSNTLEGESPLFKASAESRERPRVKGRSLCGSFSSPSTERTRTDLSESGLTLTCVATRPPRMFGIFCLTTVTFMGILTYQIEILPKFWTTR